MFASLLIAAVFTSSLFFYAEAQRVPPPRCDDAFITKIYDYWKQNGGIPQRVIERNIKLSEREVAVLSTPDFADDDVTCCVIRHFADANLVRFLVGNNVTTVFNANYEEFHGQVFESLSKITRFEIAQCGGAKLVHICSRHPDAEAGSNWFMIRGVEGQVTEEGREAMKELLVWFGFTGSLRTYAESCPVPDEEPLIASLCGRNSCSPPTH